MKDNMECFEVTVSYLRNLLQVRDLPEFLLENKNLREQKAAALKD